jgi:alpha 1,3-glucosidase
MKTGLALALSSVALMSFFQTPVISVDRQKFKTCHQASFCRRLRAETPGNSPYSVDLSTLTTSATTVEVVVNNDHLGIKFRLEIFGLKDQTFRFKMREAFPIAQRFEVPEVLVGDPVQEGIKVEDLTEDGFSVLLGSNKMVVYAKPLKMDFYSDGVLVVSANARGLMKFEQFRARKEEGTQVDLIFGTMRKKYSTFSQNI